MPTMLTATASPLLAAATSNGDIGQGVMLMFMGMGLVFIALAILMVILMIMRATIGSEAAASAPAPAPAAATAPPPPAADSGIDPKILAVLTAAAIAVVRAPIRLKSVTFIRHDGGKDWASHGRAAIHTSHRLRKGNK